MKVHAKAKTTFVQLFFYDGKTGFDRMFWGWTGILVLINSSPEVNGWSFWFPHPLPRMTVLDAVA